MRDFSFLLLPILLIPLAGAFLNGLLTLISARTHRTPSRALSTAIALLGSIKIGRAHV